VGTIFRIPNTTPIEKLVKDYLGIDEKINYSIKAYCYKHKGILGMNSSSNNVPLASNQHFGQSFDVKNIFRPYPLIIDKNLDSLAKSVTR